MTRAKKQRLGDTSVHVHGDSETTVYGPGDEIPSEVASDLPERALASGDGPDPDDPDRSSVELPVRGVESYPPDSPPEPSEDGPAIADASVETP